MLTSMHVVVYERVACFVCVCLSSNGWTAGSLAPFPAAAKSAVLAKGVYVCAHITHKQREPYKGASP